MFLNVIVPESYKPGKQIKLLNAKLFADSSGSNILMKCETTIIKDGESAATSVNTHTSTNSELTLGASGSLTSVGVLDLSDGVGEINAIPVAIGDLLIIRLFRDFNNETTTTSSDARMLKYSASVSFEG